MNVNRLCKTLAFERVFAWFFMAAVLWAAFVASKWTFYDAVPSRTTYVHQMLLTKPVKIRDSITPSIETSSVVSGQSYWRYIEYCTTGAQKGKIFIHYIDGVVYGAPATDTLSVKGCFKTSIRVNIPSTLPIGKYTLVVTIRYILNPFRSEDTERQKIPIFVVR